MNLTEKFESSNELKKTDTGRGRSSVIQLAPMGDSARATGGDQGGDRSNAEEVRDAYDEDCDHLQADEHGVHCGLQK